MRRSLCIVCKGEAATPRRRCDDDMQATIELARAVRRRSVGSCGADCFFLFCWFEFSAFGRSLTCSRARASPRLESRRVACRATTSTSGAKNASARGDYRQPLAGRERAETRARGSTRFGISLMRRRRCRRRHRATVVATVVATGSRQNFESPRARCCRLARFVSFFFCCAR